MPTGSWRVTENANKEAACILDGKRSFLRVTGKLPGLGFREDYKRWHRQIGTQTAGRSQAERQFRSRYSQLFGHQHSVWAA